MGSIGSVTFPLSLTPLRPDLRSYPELSWWFSCAKSRLTLCFPMDCSLPGSSVPGILQARILEWVTISFSQGSSQPRNRTQVSCIAGRFFTDWTTRETPLWPYLPQITQTGTEMQLGSRPVHADGWLCNFERRNVQGFYANKQKEKKCANWNKPNERSIEVL